jgi:hypothetical protein
MNQLTSQQRKLVYLGAIVVLLVPIIWLGMPAGGGATDGESGRGIPSGGKLAQLRHDYDLGESTLGDVDPASTAMNLVLLGLRGPASSVLSMQLDQQKATKQWAEMRATVESIIRLQPHFLEVWRFQGWNLAYNVSAQWDAVPDRYYWVKEGGKFLTRGTRRNERYPDLYWDTGNILGKKIGRSDEWRYFRRYFHEDPDTEQFEGGADPEFNPYGEDNYIASKRWFDVANDKEAAGQRQRIMDRMLFRSYPARSQFDYADALQREGTFGEVTMYAWDEAFDDWTREYRFPDRKTGFGQEIFEQPAQFGGNVKLEVTSIDEIRELAESDGHGLSAEQKAHWINHFQKMTNYPYWRTRAIAEKDPETVEAHRNLYEGRQRFRESRLREAKDLLEAGLERYERVFLRYPNLLHESLAIEEALIGVLYWKNTLTLLGEDEPETYPLKELWDTRQPEEIEELERMFRRDVARPTD